MYYQTNYLLSAAVIFSLVFFWRPQEMIIGLMLMVSCKIHWPIWPLLKKVPFFPQAFAFGLSIVLQNHQAEVRNFKRDHPLVVTSACFALGYYLIYKLTSVAVFLSGVMLPIAFMLVHASLRMRNVMNKLTNAGNVLGLSKQSPMGFILETIGIEPNFKYQ